MRFAASFLLILAGVCYLLYLAHRADKRNRRLNAPAVVGSTTLALTPGGKELERSALDMARVLDEGLRDPVLRLEPGWEERAKSALRDYYGDD